MLRDAIPSEFSTTCCQLIYPSPYSESGIRHVDAKHRNRQLATTSMRMLHITALGQPESTSAPRLAPQKHITITSLHIPRQHLVGQVPTSYPCAGLQSESIHARPLAVSHGGTVFEWEYRFGFSQLESDFQPYQCCPHFSTRTAPPPSELPRLGRRFPERPQRRCSCRSRLSRYNIISHSPTSTDTYVAFFTSACLLSVRPTTLPLLPSATPTAAIFPSHLLCRHTRSVLHVGDKRMRALHQKPPKMLISHIPPGHSPQAGV